MNDYWFDFIEYMKDYMSFEKYLLIYLYARKEEGTKINALFWSNLLLFINMTRRKITFWDGTIITPKGCVKEMEDCYIKEKKEKYMKEFMESLIR